MRLGIATIDYLRADAGLEHFKMLKGFTLFENHYGHDTATKECFARFTRNIVTPVHFITDGSRLRGDAVFSTSKVICEDTIDIDTPENASPDRLIHIGRRTTELCIDAFEERYAQGNDEVIWVHFFRRTHAMPVLKDYYFRSFQVVEKIKKLIELCPGDWIVSADHGLDFKLPPPHREVGAPTLHVPLASNCLPINDGYTHHGMLAEFINTGKFQGDWEMLKCFDSFRPGTPEYRMDRKGLVTPVSEIKAVTAEEISAQMEKLGYL